MKTQETPSDPAIRLDAYKKNITARSRLDANQNYAKNNYDRFFVQVEKGMQTELDNWVKAMHQQYPDDKRYATRNNFIISLIEKETGLQLKDWTKDPKVPWRAKQETKDGN